MCQPPPYRILYVICALLFLSTTAHARSPAKETVGFSMSNDVGFGGFGQFNNDFYTALDVFVIQFIDRHKPCFGDYQKLPGRGGAKTLRGSYR